MSGSESGEGERWLWVGGVGSGGIRVQDTLNSEKFIPHPATGEVIDWFTRHGGDAQMKDAARLAKQLYTKWVAANQPKVKAAQRTFDFAAEEA